MRPRILLLLLLLNASIGRAQPALDSLNALYAGSTTFRVDRTDRLIMDHFTEGRRTEQTVVALSGLDESSLRTDTMTMQLQIRCTEASGRCISRESFKQASITRSGRTALSVSPASMQQVLQAFAALVEERRSLTYAPVAKP